MVGAHEHKAPLRDLMDPECDKAVVSMVQCLAGLLHVVDLPLVAEVVLNMGRRQT